MAKWFVNTKHPPCLIDLTINFKLVHSVRVFPGEDLRTDDSETVDVTFLRASLVGVQELWGSPQLICGMFFKLYLDLSL